MKGKNAYKGAVALFLTLALCLSLSGCSRDGGGQGDAVAVQSVSMLMGLDLSGANRYCGVAQAKSTEKVKKDANKDVDEVKVVVGQQVKKGDVLFTYDTESIRLSVESAELEVEQLENSITSYAEQIKGLEKDKKGASSKEKLSYSLQIQETMLDKAEAEYNLKKKEKELAKLKKSAEKTQVKAGVDGVIQSISRSDSVGGDEDYSDGGNGDDAFLTIMETGTYRVKGSANETNIGSLSEGMPMIVYSRTDYNSIWTGTLAEIDTGSAEKSESDSFSSDSGSEESASRYSFYVQLDDSQGMMMGQHVYILPGTPSEVEGIELNAAFVEKDGENACVWAASGKDTLEKRSVKLGEYNEQRDSYPILEGLGLEDYVAQCAPSLTEGLPVVKYDTESYDQEGEGDSSALGEEFGAAEGSMWMDDAGMGESSMDFPEGSAFAEGDYMEDFADDAAIDGRVA